MRVDVPAIHLADDLAVGTLGLGSISVHSTGYWTTVTKYYRYCSSWDVLHRTLNLPWKFRVHSQQKYKAQFPFWS